MRFRKNIQVLPFSSRHRNAQRKNRRCMYVPQVEEMSLEDYLEDSGQLCWKCKKACGLCSWSHHFEPIPGWTAKPIHRRSGTSKGIDVMMDTFSIKECPEYDPEEKRQMPYKCHAE